MRNKESKAKFINLLSGSIFKAKFCFEISIFMLKNVNTDQQITYAESLTLQTVQSMNK